jgi:hypothetical protein
MGENRVDNQVKSVLNTAKIDLLRDLNLRS